MENLNFCIVSLIYDAAHLLTVENTKNKLVHK